MKMNLDDTWKNCLSMWRWIAKEVRNGNPVGETAIEILKDVWVKQHDFDKNDIESVCFFCQYDREHEDNCSTCPGRIVDEDFHCNNLDYDLCWFDCPVEFYNKLVSLNRKRLKAKK